MAAFSTSTQLLLVDTISYRWVRLFSSAPNLQWRLRVALCNYYSKETLGRVHSNSLLLPVHRDLLL